MEERKHVSEEERKKGVLIFVLIGILIAIMVVIVIIMIPKGNNDDEEQYLSSKVTEKVTKNSVSKSNEVKRDKNKVKIEISSVTAQSAFITITDKNENKYEWYPKYSLQGKIKGKWEDLQIKGYENMVFSQDQLPTKSGVTTQSIVWIDKYGVLDEGEYRVVKEANGVKFYGEFEVVAEEDEDDTKTTEDDEYSSEEDIENETDVEENNIKENDREEIDSEEDDSEETDTDSEETNN